MVIKTASPGIVVNEVDLTKGTSDAITTNVGAFAGPFARGPVGELTLVTSEVELQRIFGDPTDENYEYWYTVSNFLEYGGVCYVIRTDDSIGDSSGTFLQTMKNATDDIEVDSVDTPIYVKNEDDFTENYFQTASAPGKFVAQSPGTWANGLGIAVIDHGADYQVALKSTDIVLETDGTASSVVSFDPGVAAGDSIGEYIKVVAAADTATIVAGDMVECWDGAAAVARGIVMAVSSDQYQILVVDGTFAVNGTNTLTPDLGLGTTETAAITELYAQGEYKLYNRDKDLQVSAIWVPNSIAVATAAASYNWPANPTPNQKVTASANGLGPAGAGDTYVYSPTLGQWIYKHTPAEDQLITDGTNVFKIQAADDWYTQQEVFAGLPWHRFASRPGTTQDARDRGCSNDELNVIVYDAAGNFTGSKGNTLETYFGVSKLKGAVTQEGERNYYIDVITDRSAYIWANQTVDAPTGGYNSGLTTVGTNIAADLNVEYIEVKSYVLAHGVDNFDASLGELQDAYNKLTTENLPILDYILQGPSMSNLDDSVAKANFLISVAEERRDCMVFLSPPRYAAVNAATSAKATEDIVEWANELSSSSYAVFDSGYKYTYDRFNDQYRYIPLNGDIAGLLVFASLTAEPWYSPAGLSRGQIRNVVKLPYNPSKKQRDQLYTARVNPVVTFPGEGTILFGDKTALGYSSAFDRINVRRLFLVIEREIAKISRTTLFEFNDDTTRSLFKNNVNPFLRDVQAKRGMYDFLVVCDSSNNTPEVIDRNEFIADIYIKPAKSINFITLNFIATKTGVSFDESVALFRGN